MMISNFFKSKQPNNKISDIKISFINVEFLSKFNKKNLHIYSKIILIIILFVLFVIYGNQNAISKNKTIEKVIN